MSDTPADRTLSTKGETMRGTVNPSRSVTVHRESITTEKKSFSKGVYDSPLSLGFSPPPSAIESAKSAMKSAKSAMNF